MKIITTADNDDANEDGDGWVLIKMTMMIMIIDDYGDKDEDKCDPPRTHSTYEMLKIHPLIFSERESSWQKFTLKTPLNLN